MRFSTLDGHVGGVLQCVSLLCLTCFPPSPAAGSSLCVATGRPCPGLYRLPPCESAAVNGPSYCWAAGLFPLKKLGTLEHVCLAAGHRCRGPAAGPSLPTAACAFRLLHVLTHTQCPCRAFILLSDTGSVTSKERSKPGRGGGAGRRFGNRLPGLEVLSLLTQS